MNPDLYSSTRRSATAHNEQRTGERRLAVLASIRTARNLGRVCSVAAAVLGTAVAAVLTGFGLWAPILSKASVIGCVVVAVSVAWGSAVLLPAPSSGARWFGAPVVIGLAAAAITGQWWGFAAALGCLLIPLLSLLFYRSDARRPSLAQ